MKQYDVARIDPNQYYTFARIAKDIKVSWTTLHRWRKEGRLIVVSTNRSLVQGLRLIEAIQNKHLPA